MSFRHIIPLLRLRFVPMILIPQWLGIVLATGQLNPMAWPELWGRIGLAALALFFGFGPVYLLNDAVDVEDDRANPRRQQSPLVRGLITPREAIWWGVAFQLAGLVTAYFVSTEYFLMMCLLGVWAVLYSVPPFRCKARAGFDILIQAGTMGFLIPLSGWAIVRPFAGSPWWWYLHTFLGWIPALLLVMLYDLPTDQARGIRTTSVCLGARGTLRACVITFGISLGMLPVFAATQYLITPQFLNYTFPVTLVIMLFLPGVWRLRSDPVALKRHVYRIAYVGLLPYILWFLVLGGVLPG
jgi:4-hydroxybenzoate polyprenyltransferase